MLLLINLFYLIINSNPSLGILLISDHHSRQYTISCSLVNYKKNLLCTVHVNLAPHALSISKMSPCAVKVWTYCKVWIYCIEIIWNIFKNNINTLISSIENMQKKQDISTKNRDSTQKAGYLTRKRYRLHLRNCGQTNLPTEFPETLIHGLYLTNIDDLRKQLPESLQTSAL